MIRAVIADDEELARYTLRSMVEEINDLPIKVVGEAADGKELAELIKKKRPEVVFVDIRMPIMTGLEAIEEAQTAVDTIYWIVVSGYSEFNYAQRALRLNVSDYLLKPVDPEEVEKALRKVNSDYKNVLRQESIEFSYRMNSLINGITTYEQESEYLDGWVFNCGEVMFDTPFSIRGELYKHERNWDIILKQKLSGYMEPRRKLGLIYSPYGNPIIVEAREKKSASVLPTIADEFVHQVNEDLTHKTTITIFLSGDFRNFPAFLQRIHAIDTAQLLRLFYGFGSSQVFDDTALELSENAHIANVMALFEALFNTEIERNLLDIDHIFQKLVQAPWKTLLKDIENSKSTLRSILTIIQPNWAEKGPDLLLAPEEAADYIVNTLQKEKQRVFKELNAQEEHTEAPSVNTKNIITKVTKHIQKYYMKDLGIAQIAYNFGLTPNYLSSLFHKEVGKTFITYLTEIRLKQAIYYMHSGSMSIKEIGEVVGYQNSRHFSRVFKKYYGMTPTEYRESKKMTTNS